MKPIFAFVMLFIAFHGFQGFAQNSEIKKGDSYFKDGNFILAKSRYARAYRFEPNAELAAKLADCYIKTREFDDAQIVLSAHINDSLVEYEANTYLQYAELLRRDGQYKEALIWYDRYESLDTSWADLEVTKKVCEILAENGLGDIPCHGEVEINYCVQLDAVGSIDPEKPDVEFEWEFDDGTTDAGLEVKHCFDEPGDHEIWLHTFDPETGVRDHQEFQVELAFAEEFQVSYTGAPYTYSDINFDAAAHLPDSTEFVFWDYGDASSGAGTDAIHQYNYPGSYRVRAFAIGQNKKILSCAAIRVNITKSIHGSQTK